MAVESVESVDSVDSGGPDAGGVPVGGGRTDGPESGLTPDDKGFAGSIWMDMLALIGVFLVANLLGSFFNLLLSRGADADPEFGMFVSYVTAFGITIGFAIWQRIRRGSTKPLLRAGISKAHPLLILWGVVLVIVTSVVLEPLLNLFPAEYIETLQRAIGSGGWAIMTSIVAAPILEEVLFRGIVQESLTEKLGGWRGVVAASAIFGIIHIIPQQVINAFFIALILGFIYIKTRSVVPVILIHAINNAIAFIQMVVFGDEGMMTTRQMINNDVLYWVVYGAFCVVFVIALVNLWSQLRRVPAGRATARRA